MDIKESLAARVVDAGGKLKVKSALNPILWLCAIVSIPCISLAMFIPELQWPLFILATLPVGTAIVGFIFLLIWDRDKLQSEEYQLKKQTLEFMQQKGQALPSLVSDVELVPPPRQKKMLEGGEE